MDCDYQHAIELKDQLRFLKSIIEIALKVVGADLACNFCENLFLKLRFNICVFS